MTKTLIKINILIKLKTIILTKLKTIILTKLKIIKAKSIIIPTPTIVVKLRKEIIFIAIYKRQPKAIAKDNTF